LVGPQLAHPSLTDLLTENHIGLLRARLIEARTNEGTINNRIGRLNQLMAVTRGLARTHIRTPVATPSDEPGQTTAYSIEEMAVLRELGDQDPMVAHIISAGLDAGLTVKHHLLTTVWRGRGVTETDWVHARDYAARAGVALVATRLRATWRQRLVDQPVPFTRLVTAHGLTSTDLSHVRPADTGTVLAHTDALR
jgi:hypothetical protein